MGSADASEFVLNGHKLNIWDFLHKKELWACACNTGKYTTFFSLIQ